MIYEGTMQKLESLRKKYLFCEKLMGVLKRIPTFLFAAIFLSLPLIVINSIAFIIIFAIGFIGFWAILIYTLVLNSQNDARWGEIQTLYKSEFVESVLREQLDSVEEYNGMCGFSRQEVQEFGLLRLSATFHSEDYVKGQYKGIGFEQSEVTVIRYSKHNTKVYFEGRVLKLISPKRVSSVKLFSNSFKYRDCAEPGQVVIYGGILPVNAYPPGQIQTEDVEFNNRFDVWSKDEQEALYLLTPHFMETMKRLAVRYPNIALHFEGDNLYVAIGSTRDTFDCALDEPIQYNEERKRIVEDINDIKCVLDILIP